MNLKNIGKVFTSKFVRTGPSSYKKRIYRAAVSQRLRNTNLFQSAALWLEQIAEFWWVGPSDIHLGATTEIQSGNSQGGAFGWDTRAADQKVTDSIPEGGQWNFQWRNHLWGRNGVEINNGGEVGG
jgi:hypothetical protein